MIGKFAAVVVSAYSPRSRDRRPTADQMSGANGSDSKAGRPSSTKAADLHKAV